ncbi:MAG TPA: hypothetical protein VFM59_08300, partial [Salinimicrobium sp.]|nr:hypothetical protein [Salinimicrobium sp.]
THKPNGISISKREIPSPGILSYKTSDLLEIEDKERKKFNAGDEISVFILFTDGKSEGQEKLKLLLGTAYRNTSMIVYEEVIRNFAVKEQISVSEIESTALKHEFGHLFGLVGNGSPVQSLHEDSKNKSHCNVSSCLMAASVQFSSTQSMAAVAAEENFSFDENCLADLRANGGK